MIVKDGQEEIRLYLMLHHTVTGAVPQPGPRATLLDCVSLCAPVGNPQCFKSGAVLSCPARSVFVGRVTSAGSSGDGKDSCTTWQWGIWCGLQCSPHAQVSVWLECYFFSAFSCLMISSVQEHAQTLRVFYSVWMEWVGRSSLWLSRKKAMYERGRFAVCTFYPGAYTIPQPLWFTWLYFVILFSCCSASSRIAGLS